MKIVVLTGSPRLRGTTAALADRFCQGAGEAGHQVTRINAAELKVHPCTGCGVCEEDGEVCIFDDDMNRVEPALLEADAVVLVSPLYYFGVTAQLKTVIDRFYSFNEPFLETPRKAALISAGADDEGWVMEGLKAHFAAMCRYLNWESRGEVLALDAPDPESLEGSPWPEKAYQLGRAF